MTWHLPPDDRAIETAMRDLLGHGPVVIAAAYHLDTGGARLPAGVDRAYRNLADRLDSALTEVSDAA